MEKENKSSFKKLPQQIEWALPFLIAFLAYVTYHKTGIVLGVCLITFAIMVNGWISSKATGDLYSDGFLAIDIFALCMYLSMTLCLYYSGDTIEPKYFLYSGLLCFSYMLWDIIIKPLISFKLWQAVFRYYVIYMAFCGVLHSSFYFLSVRYFIQPNYLAIASIFLWILTLAKWHYDKIKMSS